MNISKVYLIVAVLLAISLLCYFYINFTYWSYEDETKIEERSYYITTIAKVIAIVIIPILLFYLQGISHFIGKIKNSFSVTISTYSSPKFQYPEFVHKIPWKLVVFMLIYGTLIFIQYKILEMVGNFLFFWKRDGR
jgi:amino acid transporter